MLLAVWLQRRVNFRGPSKSIRKMKNELSVVSQLEVQETEMQEKITMRNPWLKASTTEALGPFFFREEKAVQCKSCKGVRTAVLSPSQTAHCLQQEIGSTENVSPCQLPRLLNISPNPVPRLLRKESSGWWNQNSSLHL